MTTKEKLLLIDLLKLASVKFPKYNNEEEFRKMTSNWSQGERDELMLKYFEIEKINRNDSLQYFSGLSFNTLMEHFANKLEYEMINLQLDSNERDDILIENKYIDLIDSFKEQLNIANNTLSTITAIMGVINELKSK